jgi:hypothetical protein
MMTWAFPANRELPTADLSRGMRFLRALLVCWFFRPPHDPLLVQAARTQQHIAPVAQALRE